MIIVINNENMRTYVCMSLQFMLVYYLFKIKLLNYKQFMFIILYKLCIIFILYIFNIYLFITVMLTVVKYVRLVKNLLLCA